MPVDPSDQRDIRAGLQGDGEAYARLVRRYQNAVAGRMWRFTRDRQTLEELVHEVFVEAYVSLRRYRGEAPLAHWLNRIATRVGYRFWKRQRRPAARTVELQDWDAVLSNDEERTDPAEAGRVLHELMGRLGPRDRLVLTLMYMEELSVEQVAQRTGWSKTMVKVQAFRARRKLRKLFEDIGVGRTRNMPEDRP